MGRVHKLARIRKALWNRAGSAQGGGLEEGARVGEGQGHLLPAGPEAGLALRSHALGFAGRVLFEEPVHEVGVGGRALPGPEASRALEAMAQNCNVIVSAVGGLGEVVEHEVNGLTVYPNDTQSIGWAVNQLLEIRDHLDLMRQHGVRFLFGSGVEAHLVRSESEQARRSVRKYLEAA